VCWDNAAAESFFAALKNEMYHRQAFPQPGPCEVRRGRLHRGLLQPPAAAFTLGYRTPAEVLTAIQTASATA
jgi:putative transposase